jgi:hypothetical protein
MDNEPILEIDGRGCKRWWLNDDLHRVDGPAVEYADGHKSWWINNKYHRADGPAVVYADGHKSWWLNGENYKFDRWLEANTYISEEEKLMLKLTYG